jgi:hypothetical protein
LQGRYDPKKNEETEGSTAAVDLDDGYTCTGSDISLDVEEHNYDHPCSHLWPSALTKTAACRRCSLTRTACGTTLHLLKRAGPQLVDGPWFPYLVLGESGRLADHGVDRPKAIKSAGMKGKCVAAEVGEGAADAVVAVEDARPAVPDGATTSIRV